MRPLPCRLSLQATTKFDPVTARDGYSGGCWDYNTSGQVVLIGPACNAVEMWPNADVQIVVGCATQVQ